MTVASRLQELETLVRGLGSVLVCYSGGIDSALVLAAAHRALGERAVGMTAVSPSLPAREREEACRIAQELNVRHELVASAELLREGYVANGPDRCLHCKTELYELAASKRIEWNLAHILNGTNTDDLGDYRPGLEAARRADVRSPLVELGIGKSEVRALAQELNLRVWNKPAAACLSSRIPYGTPVTRERLAQVEGFEDALHELGFVRVRVRWHDVVARIEVPPEDLPRLIAPPMAETVTARGRQHGFSFVTADLLGYRTGSFNELLGARSLRVVR